MALGTRGLPGDLVELHLARGQVRVVLGMAGLPEQKLRDALELGAALLDASGHAPRPWPYAGG